MRCDGSGGEPYMLSTTAALKAGLLPLLRVALKDYEVRQEAYGEC